MKKRDWNYWILLIIGVILLLFSFDKDHLFASTTDWFSQHTAFPDYFRKLFYSTWKLFPNFAPHIGAGQNIYYFSYYGFLNPVYLVSYLLPFIKMVDYIQVVNILSYLSSILFCYYFLKREYPKEISFVCSILFLSAAPLLFHFHRHIMFVHYMPFLLMALIGIQNYTEKKNPHLLIFGIFMMIMTSYYYSVGGLICLAIFALYKGISKKFSLKEYFHMALYFLLGIGLSSILLLPTAYIILEGGRDVAVSYRSLLLPSPSFTPVLYSNYCIGVTIVSLLSLFFGVVNKRKEVQILSILLLILFSFPIFSFLLNGKLYVRSKVFIPFLPVIIYMTAELFKNWRTLRIKEYIMLGIFIILCFFQDNDFIWIDFGLVILSYFALMKFPKMGYLPILLCSIVCCININQNDTLLSKSKYQAISSNQDKITLKEPARFINDYEVAQTMNRIPDINAYSLSFYSSVFNTNYEEFFLHEFRNPLPLRNKLNFADTNNGLFSMYMGASYYYGDNPPIGYKLEKEGYKNTDVLPIAYVSSNITSLSEYRKTLFPYNLENLYQTVVVEKEMDSSYEHHIKEIPFDYEFPNLDVQKTESGYEMTFQEEEHTTIHLKESIQNQFYILEFDLLDVPSCRKGDIWIRINGQTNKLTCNNWMYFNGNTTFHYVLSSNDPISDLDVTFSKGHFKLGPIKSYVWNYEDVKKRKEEVDPVSLTIKGDTIEGKVEVKKDGYFILNVPYDKGFRVTLDGKKIPYEKVNVSFLGFPIKEGVHEIKITYEAPYQSLGMILSVFSLGIWTLLRKKKKI